MERRSRGRVSCVARLCTTATEEPRVRHSKIRIEEPSSKASGLRSYSLPVRTLHHGLNGFRKSQILNVRSCHQLVSRSHQHVIRIRTSSSLQHTSSHHIFLLQMGAQNRWDPIYKCGQAGTTKASATSPLTIRQGKRPTRNGDLHSCNGNETSAFFFVWPCAFGILNSLFSHIVITIRSLETITKSQRIVIWTIFRSFQFGINNPNSVIMQGRITIDSPKLTFIITPRRTFFRSHTGTQHVSK